MKHVVLGTLAYTVGTFVLAVVWHVVLFEERYKAFGYLEGEPNFLLGLLTILLQGVVLSVLFPWVQLRGHAYARAMKYVALVGAFFWTSHVLAFLAKQAVEDGALFALMETFYLCLQFGLFGVCLGWIHRKEIEAAG